MKYLILLIVIITSCQKKNKPSFDFWIIEGKINKERQSVYTFKRVEKDSDDTIGVIYSESTWAEEGDTLIKVADGSFMRWKVVTNPNHPDWGNSKEVQNGIR